MFRERRITDEELTELIGRWMDYAVKNLIKSYADQKQAIIDKMVEAGFANTASIAEGKPSMDYILEQGALEYYTNVIETNHERLFTLAKLTGRKKPGQLKNSTVVSIGGGPGDAICEPWFPRMASLTGAEVINFDYSQQHQLDLGMYTHIGESEGDIFRLLLNEKSIHRHLAAKPNISIIECNNLIGLNVSTDLAIYLQAPDNPVNHPLIIQMRKNLRLAALILLAPNGVLAIDNAYYAKRDGQLIPVDETGKVRTEPMFPEEALER